MAVPVYVKILTDRWSELKKLMAIPNAYCTGQDESRSRVIGELDSYDSSKKQYTALLIKSYVIQNVWKAEYSDQIDKHLAALSHPGFSMDVIVRFELGDHLYALHYHLTAICRYIENWEHQLDLNFTQLDLVTDLKLQQETEEWQRLAAELKTEFASMRASQAHFLSSTADNRELTASVGAAATSASTCAVITNGLTRAVKSLKERAAVKVLAVKPRIETLMDQTELSNSLGVLLRSTQEFTTHCYNKAKANSAVRKNLLFRNSPKQVVEQLALIHQVEGKQQMSTNQFRINLFILSILVLMAAGIACLSYYYFAAHLSVAHFAVGIALVGVAFISTFCYHLYQQRHIGMLNKYLHTEKLTKSSEEHLDGMVAIPLSANFGVDQARPESSYVPSSSTSV